jgi:hypothetical protein
VFAAPDVAAGAVIGECRAPPSERVPRFLKRIDAEIPNGPDVHLAMDNYATHKRPRIKAWLGTPSALVYSLHTNFRILDMRPQQGQGLLSASALGLQHQNGSQHDDVERCAGM